MPLSVEDRPDHVGHHERLIAEAVTSCGADGDAVVIATKGGHTRPPDDSWARDGSPAHLRGACEASLRAAGVEVIDLHRYHRANPQVPYEDCIGALEELRLEARSGWSASATRIPSRSG